MQRWQKGLGIGVEDTWKKIVIIHFLLLSRDVLNWKLTDLDLWVFIMTVPGLFQVVDEEFNMSSKVFISS